MSNKFEERLRDGLVICGEGYVFELERRGYIQAGAFVPEVVLDHPEAVKELHREHLRAGSDIMLALTFYADREKLKLIKRETSLEQFNRQAVRLAREIADEGDALVAGNICTSWQYDPKDPDNTEKIVRDMYEEQIRWAVDEGVDLIVAETLLHYKEAEIALDLIQEAGLPSVISFIPIQEKTADGYDFTEACRILGERGATVVGLNCGRGPATMFPLLEKILKETKAYVAALPVTYRTTAEAPNFLCLCHENARYGFPVELEPFLLTRYELADFASRAREMGIRYLGVCCGGAPHHLRAMAEALGREVPASRYSPDLSHHAVLGTDDVVKPHDREWYASEIPEKS